MHHRVTSILRMFIVCTILSSLALQPANAQARAGAAAVPADTAAASFPTAEAGPPPAAPRFAAPLPANADESADFIPVAATVITSASRGQTPRQAVVDSKTTTAVRFADTPLTVVVEAGTFADATEFEFIPQAVPTRLPAPKPAAVKESRLVDPADAQTLYRFQIEAQGATSRAKARFAKPVRMVLDLRELMPQADPTASNFFLAYQDETNPAVWHEVPIVRHRADGLISADVDHFSTWAAGTRPERWSLAWNPAAVSAFSGAATYSYPIDVPDGRAGLQPALALSYSSRGLDGRIRDSESGPIADGWSISDISIVRVGVKLEFENNQPRNRHPDTFRLTLNGQGHELFPEFPAQTATAGTMRYFAKDAPGFLIKRIYHSNTPNVEKIYWVVVNPSGVKYRLGYTADAEEYQQIGSGFWDISGHQGVPNNERSAIAWHVDTVTDTFGNQMNFSYGQWNGDETIKWYESPNPYEFSTQLSTLKGRIATIAYNYPDRVTALPPSDAVARLASAPGTKIVFTTGTQFPSLIHNIYVYHGGAAPIKEYRINSGGMLTDSPGCLNYDLTVNGSNPPRQSFTRIVNAITVHANIDANPATADGWSLPATSFTHEAKPHYGGCFYFYYMTAMRNGYGGEVTFAYASDNRVIGSYHYVGYNQYLWPVLGYSYYVTQSIAKDGRNPGVKTTYAYSTPCYGQWSTNVPAGAIACGADDAPEFGPITGFQTTTERTYDFNGTTVLKRNVTDFSQTSATTIGRPMVQKNYAGNPSVLLSETHTTYATESLHGIANMFTYVAETKQYQHNNNLVMSSKTTHAYAPAKQGGAQYGNLTDTWFYDQANAATPYLKLATYYTPNTTGAYWMVNSPTAKGSYDHTNAYLSGEWIYYDGAATNATAPTQGFVTRMRQNRKLASCLDLIAVIYPATVPNCAHAYQTIDSTFQKDSYGNTTATANYTGYGYRALKADFSDLQDWQPTQISQPNQTLTTTIAYDRSYYLYPVKTVNPAGHITRFDTYGFKNDYDTLIPVDGFQEQPGLLKVVYNPDGTNLRYEYDPFGRLVHTFDGHSYAGFGDSTKWNGDPVVRYRYWDTSWNDANIFVSPAVNQPFFISEERRPGTYANPSSSGAFALHDQSYFDGFGRTIQTRHLWAEVDGSPNRQEIYSTTAYNALGQTVCQTTPFQLPFYTDRGLAWPASAFVTTPCADPTMTRTTTLYDAFGRATKVTAPDGSSTQSVHSLTNEVTVGGESLFWKEQQIDEQNHVVARLTNPKGRMVLTREYAGVASAPALYADTEYGYDSAGNLIKVSRRDAGGAAIAVDATMTYDAFGRKIGINDPDMGVWSYAFDAADRLRQQTDHRAAGPADDTVLCFYYDVLNRTTSKSKTSAGANCPATPATAGAQWLASYSYFPSGMGKLGKPAGAQWNRDGAGAVDTESFDYDTLGRMTAHTRTLNGQSFTMGYGAFNALHQATAQTYPDGEVVTTEFDLEGANRLYLASVSGNIVANAKYNARGQMTVLDRANGGHDTLYSYYSASGAAGTGNGNFRLQTIKHNSSILPEYSYQYDPTGNIGALTENGQTVSFVYDEFNRLIQTSGLYNRTYGYDELGNLTNNNGITQAYPAPSATARQPHAVQSTSAGGRFEYDEAGNMLARTDASGSYHQTFDSENRLSEVVDSRGAKTRFYYDPTGQRTMTVAPDGTTTYYPFPSYEKTVAGGGAADVDSLNGGVLCSDYDGKYGGTGYLMYTDEPAAQRFGGLAGSAAHIVCVRYSAGAWEYDTDSGFVAFAPRPSDLLLATFSYSGAGVTTYAGQSGMLFGIQYGYANSNLAFQQHWFNGASDAGEFSVTGTHFQTPSSARLIGNLAFGVACQDGASGNGYIMYSAESVHQRFAANPPLLGNADNFICVRHNGQVWQYDNDKGYYAFVPRPSDILIASVSFSGDAATLLTGQTSTVLGITHGFVGSNLTITPNMFGISSDPGEFKIAGSSLTPNPAQVAIGSAGLGIDCTDTASGTGYIMYSAESIHTRFAGSNRSLVTSQHFACVRYSPAATAWEYDTGVSYVPFTPRSSDVLVATVNFATDTVTNLAGHASSQGEMVKGYLAGLTFTANQWGGAANPGEFQVHGAGFTRHQVEEATKAYFFNGQVIAQRRTQKAGTATLSMPMQFSYTDHLGSANTLTDHTGTVVVSSVRYLPFGEVRTGTASNWSDRGFTGHQENRDLGLTYMNARFYLPGLGRFASADTIVPNPASPQSFNRYSYVYNNPLGLTDPSGHFPEGDTSPLPEPTQPTGGTVPIDTPTVETYDNRAELEQAFWNAFWQQYLFASRLGKKPTIILTQNQLPKLMIEGELAGGPASVSYNSDGELDVFAGPSASGGLGLIGGEIAANFMGFDLNQGWENMFGIELTGKVVVGPQLEAKINGVGVEMVPLAMAIEFSSTKGTSAQWESSWTEGVAGVTASYGPYTHPIAQHTITLPDDLHFQLVGQNPCSITQPTVYDMHAARAQAQISLQSTGFDPLSAQWTSFIPEAHPSVP